MGADRDLGERVQHVHLRYHQPLRAIDHVGITQQRQIHPAAAPRPSGGGAVLLPAMAQLFANLAVKFRREGPSPTRVT